MTCSEVRNSPTFSRYSDIQTMRQRTSDMIPEDAIREQAVRHQGEAPSTLVGGKSASAKYKVVPLQPLQTESQSEKQSSDHALVPWMSAAGDSATQDTRAFLSSTLSMAAKLGVSTRASVCMICHTVSIQLTHPRTQ